MLINNFLVHESLSGNDMLLLKAESLRRWATGQVCLTREGEG